MGKRFSIGVFVQLVLNINHFWDRISDVQQPVERIMIAYSLDDCPAIKLDETINTPERKFDLGRIVTDLEAVIRTMRDPAFSIQIRKEVGRPPIVERYSSKESFLDKIVEILS